MKSERKVLIKKLDGESRGLWSQEPYIKHTNAIIDVHLTFTFIFNSPLYNDHVHFQLSEIYNHDIQIFTFQATILRNRKALPRNIIYPYSVVLTYTTYSLYKTIK